MFLPRCAAAAFAVLLCAAAPAAAADLTVRVADRDGAPVADAVVTLTPEVPPSIPPSIPAAAPPPQTRFIDQRDETFIPFVEVFRPGDSVVFRNSDHTRHHVYSFSDAGKFEFVLSPGESSPPLPLGRTGRISVGCNIHDHMITWLVVSDALRAAKSGADGRVVLAGLEPGRYGVSVWHPRTRPGKATAPATVELPAAGAAVDLTVSLLAPPRGVPSRFRSHY